MKTKLRQSTGNDITNSGNFNDILSSPTEILLIFKFWASNFLIVMYSIQPYENTFRKLFCSYSIQIIFAVINMKYTFTNLKKDINQTYSYARFIFLEHIFKNCSYYVKDCLCNLTQEVFVRFILFYWWQIKHKITAWTTTICVYYVKKTALKYYSYRILCCVYCTFNMFLVGICTEKCFRNWTHPFSDNIKRDAWSEKYILKSEIFFLCGNHLLKFNLYIY